MANRNIEVKARCGDLARAREAVRALGARHTGILRQIDTYFEVPRGRLKLRQAERDELIFYNRSDSPGARASDYIVVSVAGIEGLSDLLAQALPVRVRVEKTRDLWLLENVRIHLDDVSGLGTFLELEAVVGAEHPEEACHAAVRRILDALAIDEADAIGVSYSDLLEGKG